MRAIPLLLAPSLQRYAWGDSRFIPELLGLRGGEGPCAEAWFGAHPLAPANVVLEGSEHRLDELIAARRDEILGARVLRRFSGLPYLLKLLAAEKPLSIQVHPNRAQAEVGFAREERAGIPRDAANRCYRDPSLKSEVLVALTSFTALSGFRSPSTIVEALAALPELGGLLPPLEPTPAGLRELLRAYFALPAERLEPALASLLARLEVEHGRAPFGPGRPEFWALEAHRQLSPDGRPDRGLLFVFLMALVELEPGQGLFLPAGVPHAYLRGAGVELMASSDNVLRAGLTSKYTDTAELLSIIRCDAGRPPILAPVYDAEGVEGVFPLPAPEFDLRCLRLAKASAITRTAWGPETLLALPELPDTRVTVACEGGYVELRRGQACLVPHGVRYELSADAPCLLFRARVPGGEPAEVFRGRQPARLAFGTSGLRGLVSDISDVEAYVNTRGFLDYLVATGEAVPGTRVALAGDLRPSTDGPERSILRAVARAVADGGMKPINCGRIPTPALSYFGLQRGYPSIMVTGSHIPFDRNGIKFNKSGGEVLKADEEAILESVARVRRLEYARAAEGSLFADDGQFLPEHQKHPLDEASDEARELYRARYLQAFPRGALDGLRLGLYEHSAVGRELLGEILRGLGAEVYPIGRSETFVPIDTEALAEGQLKEIQALASELRRRVGSIDAIVSTDGDSDRPLLLGLDEAGCARFFGGDLLGAIVADYLDADAIAVPVSSNDAIERHFAGRGVEVRRTRIGSPWVIAAMATLDGARRVGWEANGGFLTGSPLTLEGARLDPLPTRDAVLPLLAALHAARRAGCTLIELFARLPARFSCSALLDRVPPQASHALLERFGGLDEEVRSVRFDGQLVRFVDAVSGGEMLADQHVAARLLERRSALERHFSAERGFDRLAAIDYLDGIRMSFANGDIAHVRPSGNAPQLRIYAVADSRARAEAIVSSALDEPDGLLRSILRDAEESAFVGAIRRNVSATAELFASGAPPRVIGTVSGSAAAQAFWARQLEHVRGAMRAGEALSFHEDLPVNQAFGLLLLWQRMRSHLRPGDGSLVAFVFGEGSRATPFTEAECGQKPAICSFVADGEGAERRYLSVVELGMRYFAPVESFLRRSGFDGIVVKWGDEIQIPTRDLTGTDPLFQGADVVRFVSLRALTADDAANKDWVGVDSTGGVTAFIPRRPLVEMEVLADRGQLQRRAGSLFGGVNLGSIAVSRALLDVLLEEFAAEVNDPTAERSARPDLDPQLFTALVVAAIADPAARARAWSWAKEESAAIRQLEHHLPAVLERLGGALARFERQEGRAARFVAMDFGDQYWGDIGQHRQMFELYMALRDEGAPGQIARALAGLGDTRDERGNLLAGSCRLGRGVRVRDSVLIDAHIDEGEIEGSVLVGTRAARVHASEAFDVQSSATELRLAARAGSYKLVTGEPVSLGPGERATTVFLPDREILLRVHESTDLRSRAENYDRPILGNPISFREAHLFVTAADPALLEARREARRRAIEALLVARDA